MIDRQIDSQIARQTDRQTIREVELVFKTSTPINMLMLQPYGTSNLDKELQITKEF